MSDTNVSEKKVIKVAVISPVRNRRALTLQFLRSLSRIDRTNLIVHIIIIDNGSTDGTSEAIAQEFPAVEIIPGDGSWWFAVAANRGFERALERNCDYMLLLCDDTVLDEKFLQYLVECAETNERSIIGGLLLLWDAPHKVFQIAPRFQVRYGGWQHLHQQTVWTMPDQPFEVDVILGNCIFVPAAALRENGLMDEKRFPHFGDAEFTPRLKKRGWKLLIDPRARIFNQPNTNTSLRKMTLRELYQAFWGNVNKHQNIRTRFRMNWVAAPTKIHALAATLVYLVRLGLAGVGMNKKWATGNLPEKPLKEQMKERVLNNGRA